MDDDSAEVVGFLRQGSIVWNEYRSSKTPTWSLTLTEQSLKGMDLEDADLSSMWFNRVDFEGSNLRNADLAGCRFDGCRLSGCDLRGIDFTDTSLYRVDVCDAMLTGCDFVDQRIHKVTFERSILTGVNFSGARLENVDFSHTDLTNTTWAGASFNSATTFPEGFDTDLAGLTFAEERPALTIEQTDRSLIRAKRRNEHFRNAIFGDSEVLLLRYVADLPGTGPASITVGPSDEFLVMSRLGEPESGLQSIELAMFEDDDWVVQRLDDRSVDSHFYVPAGDNRILAYTGRGDGDNTTLVAGYQLWDGDRRVVAEYAGVASFRVQVSSNGWLFAGYGDQQTGPGGRRQRSLPSYGFNVWKPNGGHHWSFETPPGLQTIIHCYALNVVCDTGWFTYHGGFPICRYDDDSGLKWWPTRLSGIEGIAVSDRYVAAIGGFPPVRAKGQNFHIRDRVVFYERDGDDLNENRTCRLAMPDGSMIPKSARLIARNSTIHLIHDNKWHTFNINDL